MMTTPYKSLGLSAPFRDPSTGSLYIIMQHSTPIDKPRRHRVNSLNATLQKPCKRQYTDRLGLEWIQTAASRR
jgi:hypothetical protein